ncbi:MAG: hypothetical protein PVJ04_08030 [Gemmatimonadota bacterium]
MVKVTDDEGVPVAHVPVRFSVVHGGGLLTGGSTLPPQRTIEVVSDAQGIAETEWRLGREPEHVLKVYRVRDAMAGDTTYTSVPLFVFAGMQARVTVDWTRDIEFRFYDEVLPHDNFILETPHFLTFSDASSMDVKVAYAAMAEEALLEIMGAFKIPRVEDLGIDEADPSTKITIYSNQSLDQRQLSFPVGFILYGPDSPTFSLSLGNFRRVIKHETMHVFQWLVGLTEKTTSGRPWPDVWFTEGIAEYISGGAFRPILTLWDLESWRTQPYHDNPIAIHDWSDFPDPIEEKGGGSYYPMFGLAVRYLLEESGHGKTFADVLAMFRELIETENFTYAFERHIGISLADYERDFFDLVTPFLSAQGASLAEGVGPGKLRSGGDHTPGARPHSGRASEREGHLSSEASWKELENNAETRPPGRVPEGPKCIGIIES